MNNFVFFKTLTIKLFVVILACSTGTSICLATDTVDPELLSRAGPDALFMHDMPAHYGEEVPPGMLDHPLSLAYHQAHNRLHTQKAVLEFLLDGS